MTKKPSARVGGGSVQAVENIGCPIANELKLEWVEATLQKESRGKCLCIYLDKEGGLTLDDCERFHKRIQPLLEDIEYDFLDVSSPGIDRPIKTKRDFEKNRDALVEVKLYAPKDGSKLHRGFLKAMDGESVTIEAESGGEQAFALSAVALIKPVIEMVDEDEEI